MISCDWGTTSFRLKLIEAESRLLINEVISDDGIAKLYNQWQNDFQLKKVSKVYFYLTYLNQQISLITKGISVPLFEIPIVVSGMACSSIGMKELPYADLPFYINGRSAIVQMLEENEYRLNVFLISGVSNNKDVMRGEETQLIGLGVLEPEMLSKDPICILPGTHSKHIDIQNGKAVDFKTFMTGEIFDLLIRHSILKNSISISDNIADLLNDSNKKAFNKGVQQSQVDNFLHTLFSVRINKLFGSLTDEQNFFYLSGLVIGTELRSLAVNPGRPIMLCSSTNVYPFYRQAISELGLFNQTSFVTPETMNKAIIEGQIALLKNNINLKKMAQ